MNIQKHLVLFKYLLQVFGFKEFKDVSELYKSITSKSIIPFNIKILLVTSLIESGINNIKIPIKYKVTGSKCVIYPNGNYPTKNINEKQIKNK